MSARSSSQRTISGLIIVALMGVLFLPPRHIHLAEHNHDHDHAAVEHSHWAPHQQSSRAFDDDDGPVLYIDHPAVVRIAPAHAAPMHDGMVVLPLLDPPSAFSEIAAGTSGNAVRDGPPLPAFHLRGPPVVL